jgi:hypothetical protein
MQMLGPGVWGAALRAAVKGNAVGKLTGDPWTMPGLLLVRDDLILWRHDFRHAGHQPDFARIPEILRTLPR